MLRPSDVAGLETKPGRSPTVGEWPYDRVALLTEQARQLDATQLELRDLERRVGTPRRRKHRPARQGQGPAKRAAGGERRHGRVDQRLTMPDTPND
jgi:hypothetical protein